ncbi:chaperone NapD [Campylobacter pinnipediorum]|uniref:chaperone NapD n=1 Tax=Campylobacter pinnipediorum TaxID=1965231 RepID=UPI00084D9D64|nr:chaperone NapD [Campylobacter pinnipediorum]
MNISSVIVYVDKPDLVDEVLASLANVADCEIITHERLKIVAVITVDSVNEEVKKFKELEAISGVSSVAMVYTYQEDIEFDKDKIDISDMLKNDDIKAEDIVYNGSVGYKIK